MEKTPNGVLISIAPQWTKLIFDERKKKIEVRKNFPKEICLASDEFFVCAKPVFPLKCGPFRCWVYETKAEIPHETYLDTSGDNYVTRMKHGVGRVIGYFDCEEISQYPYDPHIGYPLPAFESDPTVIDCGPGYRMPCKDLDATCLTEKDLMAYGKEKPLYGWHIQNPKRFYSPLLLEDFFRQYAPGNEAGNAPQSWRYIYQNKHN